ncbi:MAG: beta-ketoacyl-ACP synthase [Sutterellaceae bacterium]|nr:beta-ketoacyl-ACP synthase [Sutterellaceae bacterium]
MKERRVVVTGFGAISPLGNDWESVAAKLRSCTNAVQAMDKWDEIAGLRTKVACPAAPFELDKVRYCRKNTRSMGRVGILGVRSAEIALEDAGLLDDQDFLSSGAVGVSYGSSAGTPSAIVDVAGLILNNTMMGMNANTYVRMMSHTAAVNIGIFFKLKGRIIPTSSACTSGSQGIGFAYEAIRYGKQTVMVAGGSEELDASDAAIFDTLFATSTEFNEMPEQTPRPFDAKRDGLVIGEGGGALILEELEHAKARGAKIYAEVVGFANNSDGAHITSPQSEMMAQCMRMSLEDAGLKPEDIGYVNAHGTATDRGDAAESAATYEVFGNRVPVSTLKSYMGHTLGACGALEAWMSIQMMREGWFAPNLNLTEPAEDCAPLDYIMGAQRDIQTDFIMSNNFAFGGINTSLIFKRWQD